MGKIKEKERDSALFVYYFECISESSPECIKHSKSPPIGSLAPLPPLSSADAPWRGSKRSPIKDGHPRRKPVTRDSSLRGSTQFLIVYPRTAGLPLQPGKFLGAIASAA
jgi:hypothetical protein